MILFYAPDIESSFALPQEESQHCVRVLRHKKNDIITITDGKGNLFNASITDPNPRQCLVEIQSKEPQQKSFNYNLHIAIAPTKNIDRLEWMIEKCTEIGIDQITPLLCHYSERKVVNQERLEKIVVSAAKQSLKTFFPRLNPLTDISQLINNATEQQRFIAHCYETQRLDLANELQPHQSTLILIGPEGDFSEQEVKMAIEQHFVPVTLGKQRLRTETAGVVACNTAAIINQLAENLRI